VEKEKSFCISARYGVALGYFGTSLLFALVTTGASRVRETEIEIETETKRPREREAEK